MQSRYLGSDLGLNRIQESANAVAATALEQAAKAGESVSSFANEQLRRTQQLADMQSQLAQAKANDTSSSGLTVFVQEAAKAVVGYEQNKLKQKQKQQQEALAKQLGENELRATEVIEGVNRDIAAGKITPEQAEEVMRERLNKLGLPSRVSGEQYGEEGSRRVLSKQQDSLTGAAKTQRTEQESLAYGDLQVQLAKLAENEPGIERYYQAATKLINEKRPYLNVNDLIKTMDTVLNVRQSRSAKQADALANEIEKLSATKADTLTAQARLKIMPWLKQIEFLPPTEQAAPLLKQVENTIKAYASDKSLTDVQALTLVNSLLVDVTKAYGGKAEAFAKYNTGLDNMAKYVRGYQQANAELAIDGDYEAWKYKTGRLAQQYGDLRGLVAAPGEQEEKILEIQKRQQQFETLKEESLKRAGTSIDLGSPYIKLTAKTIINDPGMLEQLEANPALKDKPEIKTAIRLAKQYQDYENDRAELQQWKASQGVLFAKTNYQVAANRANLITAMARIKAAQNTKKKLTPEQEAEAVFYNDIASKNPALAMTINALAEQMGNNPTAKLDINEVMKAANLHEQALVGEMNAINAQVAAREKQLYDKHKVLEQYDLLQTRDRLKLTDRDAQFWVEQTQRAETFLQQQAAQQLTPSYGQQPNFNGSSSYGADVDERGLVRVAPRQTLNTINVNGAQIITPIVRGSYAPLTSGYGASRSGGRRKHAGIDFGSEGNEFTAALVSGTAYIRSDNNPEGYGGYVDIVGDNGYVYRYAHQGGFRVKDGQRVNAGSIISYSNGSGAGDAHLHFEVHKGATFDNNGNYSPKFGYSNTVDPIEHLKQLSAGASNVLQPRMQNRAAARANVNARVPTNAALYPQGAALQANMVQFVGGDMRNANDVYSAQRPIREGKLPWNIGNPNTINRDFNDDFGYAKLRNNDKFRNAIHQAAQELRIPAVWIADIIRQESGANMSADTIHNGGKNYGLFGFGNDSFNDVKIHHMRSMDEVAQLKLMVRYQKENGWLKHLEKRGGQATIAEFWAIMRMGTGWRRQALENPTGFLTKRLNDTGATWGDEIELLGKWAGREYSFPGRNNNRKKRNAAVDSNYHAGCKLCQTMLNSGSNILSHSHDIG